MTNSTYHRICVGAWQSERKPPAQTSQEAWSISTDQVSHNPPIEFSDANTKNCPQDEEECVEEHEHGLSGCQRWERDAQDGHELA